MPVSAKRGVNSVKKLCPLHVLISSAVSVCSAHDSVLTLHTHTHTPYYTHASTTLPLLTDVPTLHTHTTLTHITLTHTHTTQSHTHTHTHTLLPLLDLVTRVEPFCLLFLFFDFSCFNFNLVFVVIMSCSSYLLHEAHKLSECQY